MKHPADQLIEERTDDLASALVKAGFAFDCNGRTFGLTLTKAYVIVEVTEYSAEPYIMRVVGERTPRGRTLAGVLEVLADLR